MKRLAILLFLPVLGLAQTIKDTSPRTLASTTFAGLGAFPNGTVAYCTNCTSANPTAAGGAGSVVKRENGVWNGGGGTGGGSTGGSVLAFGSTALGTGAIASSTCALTTAGATGALSTDVVQASFASDPTAVAGYVPSTNGILAIIPYPTADTVNFKVCNNGLSSVTPGPITVNWRVSRAQLASGVAVLGTSAIASGACSSVVTVAATSVAATDTLQSGFRSDPTGVAGYVPLASGMLSIISWPSANAVNFKVCNSTDSSITPGPITLNWRVGN